MKQTDLAQVAEMIDVRTEKIREMLAEIIHLSQKANPHVVPFAIFNRASGGSDGGNIKFQLGKPRMRVNQNGDLKLKEGGLFIQAAVPLKGSDRCDWDKVIKFTLSPKEMAELAYSIERRQNVRFYHPSNNRQTHKAIEFSFYERPARDRNGPVTDRDGKPVINLMMGIQLTQGGQDARPTVRVSAALGETQALRFMSTSVAAVLGC